MREKRKPVRSFACRCLSIFLCYAIVLLPLGRPSAVYASPAPPTPEMMIEEGIDHYENGRYHDAIAQLQTAQTTMLTNYAIPLYVGLSFMHLKEYDKAIPSFENYLRLNPEGDEAATVRKNLTLVKKEYAQAHAKALVSGERKMAVSPDTEKTVAVADLVNIGDSKYNALSRGLAAMLVYDLSQVESIQVVERLNLQALANEMNLRGSDLMQSAKSAEIGTLLQAGKVIPGQYVGTDQDLNISTNIVNVADQQELASQSTQGPMQDFYKLEKEIAFGVLNDLGVARDKLPAEILQKVEHVHTKNLDAFTAFSAGVLAMDNGDYEEARNQFEEAVDEDDDFALAWWYLGLVPVAVVGMAAVINSIESIAPVKAAAVGALAGAASSGISGWAIVGGVAAIAAVGAGAAVAVSSSSSSDDGGATGRCNQTTQNGGNAAETHTISLGKKSGTFNFYYNMVSIRDRMTVSYQGGVLYDTGCASGSRNRSISYSGNSSVVTVQVYPNCAGGSGTYWEFRVDCPGCDGETKRSSGGVPT